jgi:hypothetical protein
MIQRPLTTIGRLASLFPTAHILIVRIQQYEVHT